MSKYAIVCQDLSKTYKIGAVVEPTLRGTLRTLFGPKNSSQEFRALSGINIEIEKGEAIGIIGRNGAGKSTLLKLISQITYPSKGHLEIEGTVASMLEVGTGFHPELTGRENVYLNGSLLGMTKHQIDDNFEEIVQFSEIGQYLDTPVKRYSSGMYLKLAFSVAAHLSADILLIDEILAVGDASFRQKCLSKMEQIIGKGRTIVLVSHQLENISKICSRCLLLEEGELTFDGSPSECIQKYLSSFSKPINSSVAKLQINYSQKPNAKSLIHVQIHTLADFTDCHLSVGINNDSCERVFHMNSNDLKGITLRKGNSTFVFECKDVNLRSGIYACDIYLTSGEKVLISEKNVGSFIHVNDRQKQNNTPNLGSIILEYDVDVKQ